MKTNAKITKLCSALVGSSILFASCEEDVLLLTDNVNFKRDRFSVNKSKVSSPFDLCNYLSSSDVTCVENIQKLAHELVTNQEASLSFSKDPSEMLDKYGLSDIVLNGDSCNLLILQSLCKPEAIQALKKEDFSAYLKLLEGYGVPMEKIIQNIKANIDRHDEKLPAYDTQSEEGSVNFVPVIPVAVVAFLYVGVATIAAIEVAAAVNFALKVSGPTPSNMSLYANDSTYYQAVRSLGLTKEQWDGLMEMAKKQLEARLNGE